RVLPAGTDTGSMIALNRTLYERARDMGGYRMTSSAVAMSQDLETALRACLADRPDSEDEVRPKERADTGSRDVSRLKIDHGSPTEGYEAAGVQMTSNRNLARRTGTQLKGEKQWQPTSCLRPSLTKESAKSAIHQNGQTPSKKWRRSAERP